jgi:hypothetical protein
MRKMNFSENSEKNIYLKDPAQACGTSFFVEVQNVQNLNCSLKM